MAKSGTQIAGLIRLDQTGCKFDENGAVSERLTSRGTYACGAMCKASYSPGERRERALNRAIKQTSKQEY